jgi:major membrane immunogen (membrane-anchored lipoprotein)
MPGGVNVVKRKYAVWGIVAAALLVTALFVAATSADSFLSGGNSLKDGYYCAEAAEFDAYGWKEYVAVCVSGGRIILVEYNAFNASGFIKSWDMNYMRVMNAVSGIYPNAYTRFYGGKFLENQGAREVDALSGATESHVSFLRLSQAVLENARAGDTETRLVPLNGPEALLGGK